MTKLWACRSCRIELERVSVARGGGILICVACDLIAVETEFAEGGLAWAAGMTAAGKRAPRPAAKRAPHLATMPRPKRAVGAR